MSSHREAPEISKDPVADSTDVYAFVSPDRPSFVTIIANFIPLQKPDSGPNFFEFGDDVLYEIHIANRPGAQANLTYQFRFSTKVRNPETFLYNTGQITSLTSTAWNRPQTYSILRRKDGKSAFVARGLPCPPVNVGPRSTPNYAQLATSAIANLPGGAKAFAGQRADAFWVDLGSIFDLGGLRPLNQAHLIPLAKMDGINSVQSYNVHTIAVQVPISELTRDGSVPTNPESSASTIGVWATASRRASRIYDEETGTYQGNGPWKQVSRLANPLFNEVIVPMARKDKWNASAPSDDATYAKYVTKPELAGLLPVLYPGAFPNLKAYTKDRADLAAILLTGIPKGIVPGFANYTGKTQADMLRLNLAIKPTAKADASPLGVVGGDLAGFPNGRRLSDDVTTIALRAVAGATIPLVDKSYTVDSVVDSVADGSSYTNSPLLDSFPYLGHPGGGYQTTPGTTSVDQAS